MGTRFTIFTLAGAFAAAVACSDDGSSPDPGSGGSSAGTANTGGSGGAAAGAAGTAGTAGSGGTAGTTSDGGESGAAGAAGETGFVEPSLLSQTGLYADIAADTLADGVVPFRPRFQLWSDAATKRRFLYLPPGTQIDTTDMDYWVYPVGTKVWKEFTRAVDSNAGPLEVRVETRLLQKIEDDEWFMVAFRWNDDLTDAEAVPDGEMNARETPHDIPSQRDCGRCHDNMTDKLLGVTAIQLSHDLDANGLNLAGLIAGDRLTDPPATPFTVPGTEAQQNVLGYLHANCGHCHNPESVVSSMIDMELWLATDSLSTVEETHTYLTTIGQGTTSSTSSDWSTRVEPGEPATSALYQRMIFVPPPPPGQNLHMPPIGTEDIDEPAVDAVEAWIESLPPLP